MPDNVVTAPDSIQPATINFNSLYEKAMAHNAGNDVAPAPVATPTPIPNIDVPGISAPAVTEPAPVAAPPVAAPVAPITPAEAKILDLPEDALVRVKIDGKDETVSIKEYRDGISREAVFTKRMQSLAEQRKQAEAELASQYATITQQAEAVKIAEAKLAEQLKQLTQPSPNTQNPAPKALDPGEIATLGDVQTTIQSALAQIQAEAKAREEQFARALGEAGQKVQAEAAAAKDAQAYTDGLHGVLAKPEYAVLKKVLPYAEESLRYQVASMEPKTIAQAIEFTEQAARGWLDTIKAEMVETAKRQEVAKAQAKLEPPAGSAPPPVNQYKPGSFFGKDGKANWDALRARAETMLGS